MGKRLQSAFAETDPEGFSRFLGQSADTDEILATIPRGMECHVVTNLAPEAADRLLGAVTDSVLTDWLETAEIDEARRLLGRLGHVRASRVVSAMDNRSRRRDLRRLAGYPSNSVGALAQLTVVTVPEHATAEEIASTIEQAGGAPDAPVIVTRQDGSVRGVLDLMRFLQNRNGRVLASGLCIPTDVLHVGLPVESVRLPAHWNQLTSLPVIDHSGRPIGYVTRAALERARSPRSHGSLIVEAAIEVVRLYWVFLCQATKWVLSRRPER
jgi:Mg/Co/Ni transporter MgtE